MDSKPLDTLLVAGTDEDVVAGYSTLAQRAAESRFGFEREVCVVDVETTGNDASRDRLIEIAAAIMDGPDVVDTFSTFVDPHAPIPAEITRLTGITDDMVAGAPDAETAVARLAAFVGTRDVIAHNAAFDRAFIERVGGRGVLPGTWLDSLVFVRIALPRVRSHRLADLAAVFAADVEGEAHRALFDVLALCRMWRVSLVGMSDLAPGVLNRIAALAPGTDWPEREWIAHVAAATPNASADTRDVRRKRVAADKAEALGSDEEAELTPVCAAELEGEFSPEGMAGRMYPGYEQRAEQFEMAKAVASAFSSATHASIEAGTGVGKSMAYLVPGAIFALRNGISVGVATKTNALMDQLVHHELPRLKAALGCDLRFVALKGYDHYLCLRKFDKFSGELGDAADREHIALSAMLLAWISQSAWGDLDVVNTHWPRTARDAVQSSQADCTKKRCRYFPNLCYLHGVRRRAASAHVIVTNHALLFRDVVAEGGILPPVRHWVIDEAHSAESEARKQLSLGASAQEISYLMGALQSKRGGLLDNVRRKGRDGADTAMLSQAVGAMQEEVVRAATVAESLFEFVRDLSGLTSQSEYDSVDLWITEETRGTGAWGAVVSTGSALLKRFDSLLSHGKRIVTMLEEATGDVADAKADLAGLMSRLADQREGLIAVIEGEDPCYVYSASIDRRPGRPGRLVAERMDVGEVLARDLYPRTASVVYTSATIAVGESFEHFEHGVGLDRLDREMRTALRLSSSYDFDRQMTVYVPVDIAAPGEPGYMESLEHLLEGVHTAMGGSVLTLFTNRRDMERLFASLEPRLREQGLGVMMQSRGSSSKRLRDEFVADHNLSLFALKSFWEGFDAKGDTLRCVVVPRLPFGRPSDPIAKERELREGRTAWARYSLPEAVIELKQAAGRLIRSSTDTGCLVIADARVVRKSYGARFLAALPVQDVERVTADEAVSRIRDRFGS